jgi:hypothetical protein
MPEYPIHGSKYFDVREFVDERTWGIRGIKAAELIDPKTVAICDLIREKAGAPVTVNNWHFAKPGESVYKASGYRAIWEKVGGQLSQHRCGRAADVKVKGLIPLRVFQIIQANRAEFEAAGLTTMEDLRYTPTWAHVDCRPRLEGNTGILIVKP